MFNKLETVRVFAQMDIRKPAYAHGLFEKEIRALKREEIFDYVKKKYGTQPEYLWSKYPTYAVLRHKESNKWYAAVMNVPKNKLGLDGGTEEIEIIDVKCDPEMIGFLLQTEGFLPGYHMNKQHWITILLDGTISEAKILDFLDTSYKLIDKK